MARARQSQKKKDESIADLAQSVGLTMMTDTSGIDVKDWLPTEIPHLDRILGGGLPFGRVTSMYGLNSSGKSVMAVHLIKQAQKLNIPVIMIDVEGTSSSNNMRQLGADPDSIIHFQPEEGERMTVEKVTDKVKEIVKVFGKIEKPILMVWDSIAATPAEDELKEGYNPNRIGTKASAITNMTTQVGQAINQTNVGFVIINQARDDMNAGAFMGPQQKSSGGQALKHFASIRLEVKKGKQVKEKTVNPVTNKEEETYIGHIFRVITKKSKVSTPNQKAEMYLMSNPFKGIDPLENIYRLSIDTKESKNQYGFISSGSWRSYTTDAGEEIKLRHNEWIPFLESEEGQPVAEELYWKQMLANFPNWYAPLSNVNAPVTDIPFYQKLKEYYENKDEDKENTDKDDEKESSKESSKKKSDKKESDKKED